MDRIIFTTDVNRELRTILADYTGKGVFILVDENTHTHCLPLLDREMLLSVRIIQVRSGEQDKSVSSVVRIWEELSSGGARRSSLLINLGGGLLSDVGGFAASCFKRGMHYINLPTTLLAQVDASIGGKTGVNLNGLKNEIGLFSSPEAVIVDSRFLKTLPEIQLRSGFAEMIKHGLLAGGRYLEEIVRTFPGKMSEEHLLPLIQKSVGIKTEIVKADPLEQGVRKALNFGHTVAHALESIALETGHILYHGDAVTYGMLFALRLSVRKTGFPGACCEQMVDYIRSIYPPLSFVAEEARLYECLQHDKKNEGDGVNFTLLSAPGEYRIDCFCNRKDVEETLVEIKKWWYE